MDEYDSEQTTLRKTHYFVAFDLMLCVAKDCEHLRCIRTVAYASGRRRCILKIVSATSITARSCSGMLPIPAASIGAGEETFARFFCAFDTSEGATSCNALMRRPRFEGLESEAVREAILIL